MAEDIGMAIDGLMETVAATVRMDRAIEPVGRRLVREDVADAYREARRNLARRAGGGSYKRMASDMGVSDDSIVIRRGGTMVGAEFGAVAAWVFGRVTSQAALARRQYARYDRSGHIVGPLWKRGSRFVQKRTFDFGERLFDDVVDDALRREGVPR